MMETFGERLKAFRIERGLQQGELAGPGVSASYVSMLETGNRQPTDRVIEHLARVLGVDAASLAGPVPQHRLDNEQRYELSTAEFALGNGDSAFAATRYAELEARYGLPASWGLARALEATGDLEGALGVLYRVVQLAEAESDHRMVVRAHIARSRCLSEIGDDAAALEAALAGRDAVESHRLLDTDEHAQVMSALVGRYYTLGDLVGAQRNARDLLRLVDDGGSWRARGSAYWNAAGVAEASGDMNTAVSYAERALALLSEGDDERAWARCAVACAWFWMRHEHALEHLDDIDRILAQAESKLRVSGTELDRAYVETEQSRAALLRGDAELAVETANRALGRLGTEPRSETATTLLVLAETLTLMNEHAQAADIADRLEMTLLSLPHNRGAALSWRGLADVWRRLNRHDAAYRALEHALDAQSISATPGQKAIGEAKSKRGTV